MVRGRSMDSWNLKRQLMGEIQEAVRVKELNVELMEHLSFMADWILRYCERNNVRPPNLDKLSELITHAGNLVHRIYEPYVHMPTESQQRFKTPDDSTEQPLLTKMLTKMLTFVNYCRLQRLQTGSEIHAKCYIVLY